MKSSILSANQILFLEKAGKNKFLAENFYLSGGTPLAEVYLKHRYSEDLDFFSEQEFDILNINIFLKNIKKELGIKKMDFEQSFNRNLFFLHFKNEILKIEFTYFPFTRLEKGKKMHNITIDSLFDIAVNKLFTVYQRTKARDFIDLFFISKYTGFSISYLIKNAKAKFDFHIDHLQLGTQFIKVESAKDYPRMIKKLDKNELKKFFINEAKKLKNDILT
ncbi:MAG: nucleotidyl transferase AbiEii/AbiGii toxin family protein [Patescibacteria group bacterium]